MFAAPVDELEQTAQPSTSAGGGFSAPADELEDQGQGSEHSAVGLLKNAASDIIQPFAHPIDTLAGMGQQIKTGAFDLPKETTESLAQEVGDVVTRTDSGQTPIGKRIAAMQDEPLVQNPLEEAYQHPVDVAAMAAPLVGAVAPLVSDIAESVPESLANESGKIRIRPSLPEEPSLSDRAVNAVFEPSKEASAIAEKAGSKPTLSESAQAKLMSAIFGPSQEAIMARIKTPEAVTNYLSPAELSQELPKTIDALSTKIGEAEGKAYETLGTSNVGAIPKEKLLNVIKGVRAELGPVITPEDERATQVLGRLNGAMAKAMPDAIPEYQLKDILKTLNRSINWDNPEAGRANDVLKSVKGELNAMLKRQNPQYAEAMKPVEQLVKLHDDALKQFGIRRIPGGGYEATPQTEGKLANVFSKNKSMTQKTLQLLKDATGEDYPQKLKDAKLGAQFERGTANGSRRVVAGTVAGEALGRSLGIPWAGGAAGAGVGMFLDTFGGEMAGKLIDFLNTPEGAKYSGYFKSAIAKGPQALSMVNFVLKKTYPEYAKATGQ